jgi:hypothetical protein
MIGSFMPLGFYGGILEGAKWESAHYIKMKNPIDKFCVLLQLHVFDLFLNYHVSDQFGFF